MTYRQATVADAPGIARVHVESWHATYRGIIADEVIDARGYEERERSWRRILGEPREKEITFLADDEGKIVAFASGGPERSQDREYAGELYAIYSLAEYQGRGIGRQLTGLVARWLQVQGFPSMLVWVLAENPSRSFYEALGGRPVRSRSITMGNEDLEEIGYGWSDIGALLG